MGFVTLGDALPFLAEVYVRASGIGLGGLQQVSIRGATPQQVLVLLDGVPLNATAQFGVSLATISLVDVDRVEVLRGPYSAIYGGAALGGVVQVVTRKDAAARSTAGAGSDGFVRVESRLGHRTDRASVSLTTEQVATGGSRPNSEARRSTGSTSALFTVDERTTLSLSARRISGTSGVPGSTSFPSAEDELADRATLINLTWRRSDRPPAEGTGDVQTPEAKDPPEGGISRLTFWSLADALDFSSPGFTSHSTGSGFGAEWQRVTRLGQGALLTWGVDVHAARFHQDSASAFGSTAFDGDGTTTAAYAHYDTTLGQRTLLGVGVRYETHSVYGGQINPRLGVVHFVTSGVRVRGGIGRTMRAPTFGELFFPGCSNPALRPERAWGADLGVEFVAGPRLAVRVNGFWTDSQDLIIGGCNPQNIGSAGSSGLSAEVVGRLSDRWSLSANATWTSTVDRTTGQRLIRQPGQQAALLLRYTVGRNHHLSLVAAYVGERDDLDFSTFPAARVTLPSHVVFGARYERPLGSVLLRLGVDNLFEARYETLKGFPAPGRTIFFQLAAPW